MLEGSTMKYSRRTSGNAHVSARAHFAPHPLVLALAAAFVTLPSPAWAQLPTGAAVVNGTAGIVTGGGTMTITNSPNAIINWNSFSIGVQNSVRFQQQTAASQVLNRVVGNDPSNILGSLSSNGGVWLVNPYGVLFGPNARIDVGSLVASTLAISNDDFLSGRFRFEAAAPLDGQVLNQGEINTTFGGRVWLTGGSVRNEGLIESPGGNIVLAAGRSIELVDSGMPNVTVRVTAPENEALNLGSLIATASGSIDLHGGIVNQQGIVRADSVGTDPAGRVVIRAQDDVNLGDSSITSASSSGTGAGGKLLVESRSGTASITGNASATSADGSGGQIHLLGSNVGVYQQAQVDASGGAGGGEVLVGGDYQGKNPAVSNARATYLGRDASIKANATQAGDGGKVIVWGDNAARVYGTIEAKGGAGGGDGGFVETSGSYLDAQPKGIHLDAPAGRPGTWLLDPFDITIAGGEPDERFAATEGANYEVTSNQDSSVIAAWRINEQLGRGANVIVRTGTSPTSTQAGNIVVAANIIPQEPVPEPPPEPPPDPSFEPTPSPTPEPTSPPVILGGVGFTALSGVSTGDTGFVPDPGSDGPFFLAEVRGFHPAGSLTLEAHNDIIIEAGVSIGPGTATGSMPVTLIADSDGNNAGGVHMQQGSSVSTAGGNIFMSGTGISLNGASLNSGAGTIRLAGAGVGGNGIVALTGAQVHSSAPGDAITITAGRLTNAGSALSAPAGRWLAYIGPGQASNFASDLGGLDYEFVQFNAPFATPPAASGVGQHGVLLADPLSVQVKVNATRPYDATVQASFDSALSHNAPAGMTVQTTAPGTVEGSFQDPNVGTDKPISFAGDKFLVRTSNNKPVFGSTLSYVGDITAALLTYNADPALRDLGFPITGLTGTVTGFRGADTEATATTGTAVWQTDANAASPPGVYSITGSGLSAQNYAFTQAPGNATALTLMAINTPSAPQQQALQGSTSATEFGIQPIIASLSHPGLGFGGVFDISSPLSQACFAPVNIASVKPEDLAKLLDCRKDYKRRLFAEAIYRLETDPGLADVPPCISAGEAPTGMCHITTEQLVEVHASAASAEPAQKPARAATAALPQIERKIAVLFGVNDYTDSKIPKLENAVPDVDAVSKLLAEKLGYEVRVVRNARKAEIIRALNELSAEARDTDSIVVYYAGHGLSLEKNGAGYWIPSDAPANDPSRWISNSDIAKLLAGVRSRQMAVISDSCYSGAFAREGMGSVGRGATAEEILTRRSVVVLSSGGDEPVADEGKDGHSIFAWNLMRSMETVQNWRPGSTVFEEVQRQVKKEFPQTPRYGSVTSAGHQAGGDYLFEQR
jgi:filamentous hemagglutinin family protein